MGAEYEAELDLVFANGIGEPLDYRVVVQRHFKPIVKAAGLEPLRPYDLRHTAARLRFATYLHPNQTQTDLFGRAATLISADSSESYISALDLWR
jgi:integrase